MRGTAGGLVTTVLMLTLLQALVSSQTASGRLGTLLTGTGTVLAHLTSPALPAIPDLRPGANRNASPVMAPPTGGAAAAPAVATAPPRLPTVLSA